MQNNQIVLADDTIIKGNHPVILIGPNGSGKTTFGNNLSRVHNGEWIGATRNLQFSDSIVVQTEEQAKSNVVNEKNNQKQKPWVLSNELNQLLAKLKAEDSQIKVSFVNNYKKGTTAELIDTKIDKITNIWNAIFPRREIDFSSYSPKVCSTHGDENVQFGISRMSGGERVALYLLARIVDAPSGLIFIDEPEIHFHGVLAKKFWNELEILRSDCRFVYITHDLPFAVSRNNGQFIVIRSKDDQVVLRQENELPEDIIESVLGAATFSVSANKIIFCEGSKNNKRDDEVYSAWFCSDEKAVIPVGSCEEVIRCAEVFNQNEAIQGMEAIGIIDRDFHSSDYLGNLSETIHALKVHEIESLFCIKELFVAVGSKLGKGVEELNTYYDEVIDEVIAHFSSTEVEKNKIILERVKKRTEWQSKNLLNYVNNPSQTMDSIKNEYLEALKVENWSFDPESFFDEEKDKVDKILKSRDVTGLLEVFPGKTFFGKINNKLGINQNVFLNIVISALNDPNSDIRGDIVSVLSDNLPS